MKNTLIFIVVFALAAAGYYYYVRKPTSIADVNTDYNTAKSNVIQTTNTGFDDAVSGVLKGVSIGATPYYVQNKNYGVSATQNICNDTTNGGSIGSIVSAIQKYTKAVNCTPAQDFPSRSFTITAPSKVNPGEYFCADQGGFAGLIPNLSGGFSVGIKCK